MKDKIKVVIGGDSSGAVRALRDVGGAVEDTASAVAASSALFAGTFALVQSSVISVSAEFERYNVQLETIEGSADKAASSMGWVTEFAAKTPYELAQVTEAFVKLKAFGIDPVADNTLRVLGDTSSAMGKDLGDAVEALADAMTGENERLKEFGIKASVVGNKISYAYSQNGKAMVKTADKNSSEMIKATLLGIWNDKFSGGMDKLSMTWGGMVSNLGDNWMLFQKDIGDNGAFLAAKNSLSIVLGEISANDAGIKSLAKNISSGLITAMQAGVVAAALVAKGFSSLSLVFDGVRVAVDSVVLSSVQGFDFALAGLQSFYDGLAALPAGLGDPYRRASSSVASFRKDLAQLEGGVKAAGGESLGAFSSEIDAIVARSDSIDAVAVKLFSAAEMARDTVKAPVAGLVVDTPQKSEKKTVDAAALKSIESLKKSLDALEVDMMDSESKLEHAYIKRVQLVADSIDANVVTEQRGLAIASALHDEYQANLLQAKESSLVVENELNIVALQEKVQAFDEQLLSEEDRLRNSFINRAQIVADAIDANVVSEQRGMSIISGLSAQHEDAMLKIRKSGQSTQLKIVSDTLGVMASLINSKSRAMFEIGKAASIGQAGIKAYESANNAYASASQIQFVGWLLGPLAAGAALAAGLANVQKIASTSFGGGASGGAASPKAVSMPSVPSAPSSVSSPADSASSSVSAAPQVSITVQALHPDAISPDTIQMIADGLSPALNDSFSRGQHMAVKAA